MAKCKTRVVVDCDDDDDGDRTSQSQSTVIDLDEEQPTKRSRVDDNDLARRIANFERMYDVASRTDEEVLGEFPYDLYLKHTFTHSPAEQKKHWVLKYYPHFRNPEIFTEKGIVKYRFVCKTYVINLLCASSIPDLPSAFQVARWFALVRTTQWSGPGRPLGESDEVG